MQREEETHYPSAALAHQNFHQGHNHPPIDEDDDYDDDEDDEDYDSQDEDEYEGDEMVRAFTRIVSGLKLSFVGRDDRRTAHGRRQKNVSNICGPNVRTTCLDSIQREGRTRKAT